MLCWGTIAFMPLVHNLQTLHLVNNSGLSFLSQSWAAATAWIILGIIMIALNYDSDTQRHRVRALDGKCLVWGSPARVLRAPYQDATGAMHCNLLLACGYHGIVRHFHYAPDIFLLFLYCAPAGFTRLLPFTYFLYLTALLLDRCQRIDRRCHAK
jgi:7-dehydrocholesterol reductase